MVGGVFRGARGGRQGVGRGRRGRDGGISPRRAHGVGRRWCGKQGRGRGIGDSGGHGRVAVCRMGRAEGQIVGARQGLVRTVAAASRTRCASRRAAGAAQCGAAASGADWRAEGARCDKTAGETSSSSWPCGAGAEGVQMAGTCLPGRLAGGSLGPGMRLRAGPPVWSR